MDYRTEWKDRVDVRAVVKELGIEVKKEQGPWLRCLCPLHDDTHESFSIATQRTETGSGVSEPGHWVCFLCGSGNIATLVSKVTGKSVSRAMKDLIAKYAPDVAGQVVKTRKKTMPTPAMVDAWHGQLLDDEIALGHLTGHSDKPRYEDITDIPPRCISDDVIQAARIGVESGRFKLPILARDGRSVLNVRTNVWLKQHFVKGEPKIKGLPGAGVQAFPLHMVNKDKTPVICEGEFDALVLHSLGVNAITLTGGVKSYTAENWKPYIDIAEDKDVILCMDQDKAGQRAARKLRQELLADGMGEVRTVTWLPNGAKDITDAVRSTPEDEVQDLWATIMKRATVMTAQACESGGLVAEEGALVDMLSGEVVAPFVGEVVLTGRERFGIADETCRVFHVELQHRGGKRLEVVHRYGEPFAKSIAESAHAGPEWAIAFRESDRVFVWICQASKFAKVYDTGWIFGFDGAAKEDEVFDRYYTKSTVFTKSGPKPNEEVLMRPPTPFLRSFDLPIPNKEMAAEGIRALLKCVYKSHVANFTGPLIASALLAPIRRVLFPDEPRFCLMIYGQSGCGKTSRAHIVQNLFGSFRTYSEIMSWESTQKSVSQIAGYAGDSFILVDEFPVAMMRKRERDEAVRLLLGMAQGSGRARLDSIGRIYQSGSSHSIMAITSEALPMDSEAQLARALCLYVPTIELLSKKWGKPFEDSRAALPFLPHVTSQWIDWILGGFSSLSWEETAGAMKLVTKVADDQNPGWRSKPNNLRILSRVACLSRVWMLFLEFAIQEAAITPDEQEEFHQEWFEDVVPELLRSSMAVLSNSGVEEVFLDQVVSALTSGKAKLLGDGPGTQEGDSIPLYAHHNATVIGYYRICTDGTGYLFNGHNVKIALSPGAMTAIETLQEVGGKWQTLIPYLTGSGLAKKPDDDGGQARIRRRRVLWLTKRGTERVLEPMDMTAL